MGSDDIKAVLPSWRQEDIDNLSKPSRYFPVHRAAQHEGPGMTSSYDEMAFYSEVLY
jgi:hypothetical protein